LVAGLADPRDPGLVQRPQPLGDDHRQRAAEHLLGPPAEHPLRARVPRQQPPEAVRRHDRVHRGVGDGPEALLGGAQGLLGAAALHQWAELGGDLGDAVHAARLPGPLVGDEQLQHRHRP
jgi:hypothetical protein